MMKIEGGFKSQMVSLSKINTPKDQVKDIYKTGNKLRKLRKQRKHKNNLKKT